MAIGFVQRRARTVAFLLWFLAFMSPVYVQGRGLVYDQRVVWEVLSSSLIYGFVALVWPSLILHISVYALLALSLRDRRYVRYFLVLAGLEYLLIGVGQSISMVGGRIEALISNLLLILIVGSLWILDAVTPVEYEGRGSRWFLPLALFAFISPMGATSSSVPPWYWMWRRAPSQPLLIIPALLADALAGFGTVAYCLFTPLALTIVGREGALRPLTLRLTSLLGVVFSSIIVGSAVLGMLIGTIPTTEQQGVIWNAVLHVPLLVICSYYFAVGWRERA